MQPVFRRFFVSTRDRHGRHGKGSLGWYGCLLAMFFGVTCAPASRPDLPEGSPFREVADPSAIVLPQGVASGDVTHRSAIVWARTEGPALVQVEWWPALRTDKKTPTRDAETGHHSPIRPALEQDDFTLKIDIDDLQANTEYRFRVWTAPMTASDAFRQVAATGGEGRFRTAPLPEEHREVSFVWSGDLGGQNHCRQGARGYPILDQIRAARPQFFLFLGDLVYADEDCDAPPNVPGSDFRAATLDDYRVKHRYQRGAPSLRELLAEVPVWAMWDDHEVSNNFSGRDDPRMPAGRQALLEYWPIGTSTADPTRLYRSLRYGADLEMFILDTRQYRSPNSERDGPGKTMLGPAQLAWLIEGLTQSTATWKVIATTVPLANNRKSSRAGMPGNDSWARAKDGTGFETELSAILQACRARGVRNLIWLAGDVHYVQGTAFDPDGDGEVDFHEFIAGPLSAYYGKPVTPPPTFRPTVLFSGTDLSNFGAVTVDGQAFRVDIIDADGTVRYSHRIRARSLQK